MKDRLRQAVHDIIHIMSWTAFLNEKMYDRKTIRKSRGNWKSEDFRETENLLAVSVGLREYMHRRRFTPEKRTYEELWLQETDPTPGKTPWSHRTAVRQACGSGTCSGADRKKEGTMEQSGSSEGDRADRPGRMSDYWLCQCDCGKQCICQKENLRSGVTRSCGCLQEAQRKVNMKKTIHFMDGTCVERIACRKTFSNNTSGHRGVYRRENNRWRASIGFQGKSYNLGSFATDRKSVV